jgi:hypothetical protein
LQQVVVIEQEGLVRQCCQDKPCPGNGDQQPGLEHESPMPAPGLLSRLLGIGQMQIT